MKEPPSRRHPHHASQGPAGLYCCPAGAVRPVRTVLDMTARQFVAKREDLTPAGYDEAIEFGTAVEAGCGR